MFCKINLEPGMFIKMAELKLVMIFQDVLVLRQFMTEKGGMLPRRATGVCKKSQKELQDAIHKAQRAGMLLVMIGKLSVSLQHLESA